MNQIYILGLGLLSALLLAACDKEEKELTPTGYERDWMVITEPRNGDPVDQLRYEIYRDYEVSTYYNDTIGKEERTDILETPYTYYEILKLYYWPGAQKPMGYFDLFARHDRLIPVLEQFRDRVFARFRHPERLPAFLFVDSLWSTQQQDVKKMMRFYSGYNTIAVRVDPDFNSWDETDKEAFSHSFMVWYLANRMMAEKEWSEAFCKISKSLNPKYDYNVYSEDTTTTSGVKSLTKALQGTVFTEKEQIGFITSFYFAVGRYEAAPTKLMDLESYVDAVLTKTLPEFKQEYAGYPAVIQKFGMVQEKMKAFELK